ncbi:MAG: hypothetical protein WD232_06780 [Acidimicrobiales bacterium]
MEISPFPYQGPLEPDEVRGRDALVEELVQRVTEHRVTALLGPRRYGKTSVLRRVGAELEEGGANVVWVDLYEVTSLGDVAVRLDAALAGATGAFAAHAGTIAAGAEVNLGVLRIELRRPPRERPDPLAALHGLLDVLVRAAEATATTVLFDEFSSIGRIEGAAGLLRTYLQHHYRTIGVVFAGSEPSMMRTLFTGEAQPFYGQADLVEIGPLDSADVVALVGEGFEATGRSAGPVGTRVAAFAGGHPQRTMQLADAAWRRTPAGATATIDTWDAALGDVRAATASGLERLYSGFVAGEKAVLRLVASGTGLFGGTADVLGVPVGTAQHARDRLVERGDLAGSGAAVTIVDPVFADWINHRFPL